MLAIACSGWLRRGAGAAGGILIQRPGTVKRTDYGIAGGSPSAHLGSELIRRRHAMPDTIRFTLNGKPVSLETDPARKLLWALRTDLELTGTKYGCGEGLCGACTVIVDGQAVRSCQMDLASVRGRTVVSIEGLAHGDELSPIQQAF